MLQTLKNPGPLIISLLCIATFSCTTAPDQKSLNKPNILVILTDDQGYPTTGTYGGDIVPTPNLDQLADQGMVFTDAYVTSQCTPTRASLLTGQYTANHGMWHVIGWYGYPHAYMTEPLYRENLNRDTFTLAKGLQNAGYATGIFGKWHLTTNEDGHYRGLAPEAANYYGFDTSGTLLSDQEFTEGHDRGVRTLTEQTLQFMEMNQDKPWFCLLSHHMIHGKVVAPDSLVAKYRELGYGDQGYNRAVYLSGLELIDWSVGKIMQGLNKLNLEQETIVVFISDNGGIDQRYQFKQLAYEQINEVRFPVDIQEYKNDPLRAGKGSVYEGGVRVPMIIRWPGSVPAKTQSSMPVHVIDLMPTLLEAAGAEANRQLDGVSLITLIKTGTQQELESRPIFQYYPFYDLLWGLTPSASIRLGNYKLIEFFGDRVDSTGKYLQGYHLELYNLEEDLGETKNLASEHPEITADLKAKLHQWYQTNQVEIPIQNPHYDAKQAFVVTREKPEWLTKTPFE